MSAVARFLGWLLIAVAIGGAIGRLLNVLDVSMPTRILALCVFFAGAAIIIWSRRSHEKKSAFGPSLPSFDTHLLPRTPAWAASIEEGVSAFRSNQFSVAASHFTSAKSNGRAPLHHFISANNLAAAPCAAQRYAEAEPLYRRLIEMWHVLPAPEDGGPDISLGLNNLALTLSGQGRYQEAEATLRQALEVRDDEWGDSSPVDAIENLALVRVARDHAGASTTFEQASMLDSDASAKQRAQALGEARLWAECALAIREAELGDDHVDLVSPLMTLEEVCRGQGKDQDAARFRNRARLLCEMPFVFDDFDAVARLPRCGLWDSFARWIEPRLLSERWLLRKFSASNVNELIGKISASKTNELSVAYALDLFATSCVASAPSRQFLDFAAPGVQAQSLLTQALQIRRRTLGAEHPEVLETRERLAEVAGVPEAGGISITAVYGVALKTKTRAHGPNDPSLISTLVRLSDDARSSNWMRSIEPLERAAAIAEQAYGRNDPRLVPLLMKLAHMRHEWQGQYEAAERLYSQALGIVEQTSGPDHWNVVNILPALGDIYVKLKRPAEAGQCHRRLITLETRIFGRENFRVRQRLKTLAEIDTRERLRGDDPDVVRAAELGKHETVKQLIALGAHLDVAGRGRTGDSALMAAVRSGSKETVEVLIAAGADVNRGVGDDGWTPFGEAVLREKHEILKLLVAHGARVPHVRSQSLLLAHGARVPDLGNQFESGVEERILMLFEIGEDGLARDLGRAAVGVELPRPDAERLERARSLGSVFAAFSESFNASGDRVSAKRLCEWKIEEWRMKGVQRDWHRLPMEVAVCLRSLASVRESEGMTQEALRLCRTAMRAWRLSDFRDLPNKGAAVLVDDVDAGVRALTDVELQRTLDLVPQVWRGELVAHLRDCEHMLGRLGMPQEQRSVAATLQLLGIV